MVKHQIGVFFKKALEQHIPKGHPLAPVINKHVTKLAYLTMPNMQAKVSAHNNKMERKNLPPEPETDCNCSKTKRGVPYMCKWEGKCREKGHIYKCLGKDKNGKRIWSYIGLTEGHMKERIGNHYQSFREDRPKKEHATKLSEQVWDDRRKGIFLDLTWEKVTRAKPRGANQKRCNLCDTEALHILHKEKDSVNTRKELGGYCPHKWKFILNNINENKETKKLEKAQQIELKESNKTSEIVCPTIWPILYVESKFYEDESQSHDLMFRKISNWDL